jgi:hypothetical protein
MTNVRISQYFGEQRRLRRGLGVKGPQYANTRTTIDRTAFWSASRNAVMIAQKMILWVLRHTKGWKPQDCRTIIRPPTKNEARAINVKFA